MKDKIVICAQCYCVIEEFVLHNCVRGLTENINNLRHMINELSIKIDRVLLRMNK